MIIQNRSKRPTRISHLGCPTDNQLQSASHIRESGKAEVAYYCDYVTKVIYVNSRNQIIETADLFQGTVNSSAISPRQVIEGAIKHNAVSLIFAHNHPSGNPGPSQSDREVTRDLVYAAGVMQIKVLDHIIIGDNTSFSFAGEGLIEEYEAASRT